MPFYNIPLRVQRAGQRHLRLLRDPGPPGDDRPAGRHEGLGFRQSTLSGLSFATDDLITPPNKAKIIGDAEKDGAARSRSSTSAASSPRASATTRCSTPGPTPASRSPREMMHELENDHRDAGLRQPDLPDGPLRCPRRRRADPPAGRHARSDGQAVRQDHRDADQGQLPRRPDACWSTSARRTVPARVWPTRP